jgi:hypothetical protein
MKKTLLYILILGALGFGVWFLLFREKSLFSAKDAGFTIKDTAAIGKIFLATNNNATIKLERTPKGWIVNDKYKVRKGTFDMLMQALQYQEPRTPVSEKMHNNIVKSLMGGHIKVEVYNIKGEKMRTFYVGGETGSGTGTYMLMEGGSRPYIVQIPGFTGYLTPRYLPELKDWRDRSVFNIAPEDIDQITVNYPKEPLNDFVITRAGNQVKVTIDPALTVDKTLNKKRAEDYVGFFSNINAEQVLNNILGVRENISNMPLICTIDVKGKNGYHQDADLYFTPLTRRSKNLVANGADTASGFDSDRLYAVINGKQDTFLVQRMIFDKLFRMGYEFYMQDAPPAEPRVNIPQGLN